MSATTLELADELYGLVPGEFTPRRDALVREHKGDREAAAALKALRKPSLAAWVVNLLVRRDPDQVDQLLEVGAALREAQASLDAAQLREFTKQRRQLTAAVTTAARRLAREEGHRVSESVAQQVEGTLTAAMIDADAARAVRSGLLVQPMSATGVDRVDVAAALALPEALGFSASPVEAPRPGRPALRVVPDPEADDKALAAARERLAEARRDLAAAESEHRGAGEEAERLEAQMLQLQARADELRRALAQVEDELEETDAELEDAEDSVAIHAGSLEEAREAVRQAHRAVERLGR